MWEKVQIIMNQVFDAVSGALKVQLTGSTVEEVLTQDDAVSNVLTFTAPIFSIEIWHEEEDPQEFGVNGLTLIVAPGGWRSPVGGTPSDEVTIPAGVNCIISRLV